MMPPAPTRCAACAEWRDAAAREKPFEFYMARLEADGLRRALLARLGPEAGDAIDEFLNLALDYEASQTPTLQGFLHWLRVSGPEVKRDMEQERDEVRVMTVHGSKGLEANIVFLADTCSARSASRGGLVELAARRHRCAAWRRCRHGSCRDRSSCRRSARPARRRSGASARNISACSMWR